MDFPDPLGLINTVSPLGKSAIFTLEKERNPLMRVEFNFIPQPTQTTGEIDILYPPSRKSKGMLVIYRFPEFREEMFGTPTAALMAILNPLAHIWSAEVLHHRSVRTRDTCLTAFYCFRGSQTPPRRAYPSLSDDAS